MTKLVQSVLMSSLVLCSSTVFANPPRDGLGDMRPLQYPERFREHGGPRGGHNIADLATVAVIGGLTYYVLDNVFYQRQGNNYVVVSAPPAYSISQLTQIDYQGKRYYVKDNRFYVRDISDNYIEVPRPIGL